MKFLICAIFCALLNHSAIGERVVSQEKSPYLELILCPAKLHPWSCARDQTARLLDDWNDKLKIQWQELKVEADKELNVTLQRRGFSSSDIKEKPSTIFKKIEIGTNFIQNFVEHATDELVGRQDDDSSDIQSDEDESEEENEKDNELEESKRKGQVGQTHGQQQVQPAIIVLDTISQVQQNHGVHQGHVGLGGHGGLAAHGGHGGHGVHGGHGGGGHLLGNRKKKKRPHGSNDALSTFVQHEDLSPLSFIDDLLDFGGGGHKKHGIKKPFNYGRSIGVPRHKKKKKKAFMKLMLIGTIIKGKIELLLKILSAHLQIKFFAIALVGLIINIARFWVDLRRGGVPQKVVYYEHAHHQHHYEDNGNVAEDWGAEQAPSSGGGYWKRSLANDEKRKAKQLPENNTPGYDSYASYASAPQQDPYYMAYGSQVPSY